MLTDSHTTWVWTCKGPSD